MIARNQLELSIAQNLNHRAGQRPQRKLAQARWWFAQMHRAVDEAGRWEPPSQPAEQELLGFGSRN